MHVYTIMPQSDYVTRWTANEFPSDVTAKLLCMLSPGISSFCSTFLSQKSEQSHYARTPEVLNMFIKLKSDGDIITRVIWQAFFCDT